MDRQTGQSDLPGESQLSRIPFSNRYIVFQPSQPPLFLCNYAVAKAAI
jgi:hypothetical protein